VNNLADKLGDVFASKWSDKPLPEEHHRAIAWAFAQGYRRGLKDVIIGIEERRRRLENTESFSKVDRELLNLARDLKEST
jgi:hypothetical protein